MTWNIEIEHEKYPDNLRVKTSIGNNYSYNRHQTFKRVELQSQAINDYLSDNALNQEFVCVIYLNDEGIGELEKERTLSDFYSIDEDAESNGLIIFFDEHSATVKAINTESGGRQTGGQTSNEIGYS